MPKVARPVILTALIVASIGLAGAASTQFWRSTRITDPNHHTPTGGKARYPYRAMSGYVMRELDLKEGDVVVDIGAGDGWWAQKMVEFVGNDGVIHAAEVAEKLVEQMKNKFADTPQIKPYLCKTDSPDLPENSCDLAFFSQTYHHLKAEDRVDYLRELRDIVKKTGRICIIEKNPAISTEKKSHGTSLSELVDQAEQAGWIPVRYELMRGTYHYLAIFARKDLFGPEESTLP
ncbi:MAG: class I SAM-dependent methyltransferase [Planctomycetota bacterium]|jgi:ubiquinone/menaquinone biosynthesis C-methylase UbiE